ncbi:MAG: nickel-dependent lactate racemase [Candidatus Freyarchaeota archaeon]|nr:nickel-dependent lactate racemase [Candidatus Freyrarchaeum guaymaensis]
MGDFVVKVKLKYGFDEVCAEVPAENFAGILDVEDVAGCGDPVGEVRRSIASPINTPPVSKIVKGKGEIVVVVNDHTRDTRTKEILGGLFAEIGKAGVPRENVTIVFGCGTHRNVKEEEARRILGEEIWSRYEWVNHDCDGEAVFLGETSFGNRVYINALVAEADVKILTGDITFHYYAGYTGGRKSILPGVSARETILFNHGMMFHPRARSGVLEGNPVHLDMVEAARLARPDFIVNVVQNTKGEVFRAFSGDFEAAFIEGVKVVDRVYKAESEEVDIVLLSAGGYPKDIDFYQAYKAIDNVLPIVREGGSIVFLAECRDGAGHEVFYNWMRRRLSVDEMERMLQEEFTLGGHKAYYLARALEKVRIFMVSSMPSEELERVFGVIPVETADEGLREALKRAGRNARVKVVPYGTAVLAVKRAGRESSR